MNQNPAERPKQIARRIEDLPSLREGYGRLVHITRKEAVDDILRDGLSYRGHGMLSSVARAWEDPAKVEYWSTDRRFSFEGAQAVVMDIPFDVLRLHETVGKAPGIVSPEYIVGIVDAKKE